MSHHKLLKAQKNQVFDAIKTDGLDPFNFTWKEVPSAHDITLTVPRLEYGDGEFFFQFDMARGAQWSLFSPGINTYQETAYPGNWKLQMANVIDWVIALKDEVDEVDHWAELEHHKFEVSDNLIAGVINEPFSVSQADQIQIGLLKVRSHLEQYTKQSEEHAEFVIEQLDYLSDATRRQGKRDWLHTCMGVIMSISASLALAPDESKEIWEIIKVTLNGILQLSV